MFRRMFEKCLLRAFERSFSLRRVTNCCPTQAGFRKGFSTQSHALYSHELCVRHDLNQVFVDFKAAYDTVPMCKVLDALHRRNTPTGVISLIMSLFMNGGSKIAVNGELTRFVPKRAWSVSGIYPVPSALRHLHRWCCTSPDAGLSYQ
ncbi:hypothetical protein DSO57_1014816 [Entomophthora muscae]|uniref:Uncharacterized protein n=1 Tax=Entomophthora muscae TaxID=34485 RepID=A0ACC2RK00_9FUNG|nr:hypothetical protein DSO57_1014816 [Entomophthora muscae]